MVLWSTNAKSLTDVRSLIKVVPADYQQNPTNHYSSTFCQYSYHDSFYCSFSSVLSYRWQSYHFTDTGRKILEICCCCLWWKFGVIYACVMVQFFVHQNIFWEHVKYLIQCFRVNGPGVIDIRWTFKSVSNDCDNVYVLIFFESMAIRDVLCTLLRLTEHVNISGVGIGM